MRTREDAELVAQGKSLEQEVYTRAWAARAVAAVLKPLRIVCSVPSGDANVNGFCRTGYWRATGMCTATIRAAGRRRDSAYPQT